MNVGIWIDRMKETLTLVPPAFALPHRCMGRWEGEGLQ